MRAVTARRRRFSILIPVVLLLPVPAGAVDFAFFYDDPEGFGFRDPTLGAQRRAALEAAGDIWGRLIRPSYFGEEIVVHANYDPLDSGTLAKATPYFYYSDFGSASPQYQSDTNYPKALANHLAGRDLAPQRHEINVTVDETTSFYYGLDGLPGSGEYDFISVAVHELGHGLGFKPSFRDDGEYGLLGDGMFIEEPGCIDCLPTPYDRFLTLGPMGPTLISLDGDSRESAVTSGNVFWNGAGGVSGHAMLGVGGAAPKIYAPNPWEVGSSIGHVDDATYPQALMNSGLFAFPNTPPSPGNIGLYVRRTPNALERGMLRDMGWNISVAPSQVTWTGLGADDDASTPANWTPALPLPGDSLAFGPSPRTDVNMDLALYSIEDVEFEADAPAYTVTFERQKSTDIVGAVENHSSQTQTIVVDSGLGASPDQSGATLVFKSGSTASNVDFDVLGGHTIIEHPPNLAPRYAHGAGGRMVFEGNAMADSARFIVDGGGGAEGPSAEVVFRGTSWTSDAEFRTKGGRFGPALPEGSFAAGYGGFVRFEENSRAGNAVFHNEGQAEYFNGAGGFTIFSGSATAENSEIHNHGATFANGIGGATFFLGFSKAGAANITNHADGSNFGSVSARTVFQDFSTANTATIENVGAPSQAADAGLTEFRGWSSAANATINNRGHVNVGDLAGRTMFYDQSTASNATINLHGGYSDDGRVEFHGNSTAANARINAINVPSISGRPNNGGNIVFRDNSTASLSQIMVGENASASSVQFYDNATVGDAQITTPGGGTFAFYGSSRAGDPPGAPTAATASFALGRSSVMIFGDQSSAADADITLAFASVLQFNGNSSAGDAQIEAAGSSLYPWAGAAISFNSTSTVNNSTIELGGGAVPLASGANLQFINGSHAGNSTIFARGGTNGGAGVTVSFYVSHGDTARVVADAGATVTFVNHPSFTSYSIGAIEGAGTFILQGAELTVGTRTTDSLDTTVSGPIIDHPSNFFTGGRLTKVGAGTLTLAGTNTYSGVTTVNEGTLRVDGSLAGPAVVNNGGRLIGDGGAIPAGVTVNAGGVHSPGASPGTMSLGGLTMNPGSTLEFEIGASERDHIVLTGNGNIVLDGLLNISFLGDFTPTLGQSFPLFEGAIGSITGAFDAVIAPIVNGLTFNVVQTAGSVVLQAGPPIALAGDFNGDGSVNGADLSSWRVGFGTSSGAVHSQGDADRDGDVDGRDFLVWQRQTGSGNSASGVPEPTGAVLAPLLMALLASANRRPLRTRRPMRQSGERR